MAKRKKSVILLLWVQNLHNRFNTAQLNLIKSFKFLHSEKKISEIDSLINFYLEKKLDEAITKVESERNYNASIYEEWLKTQNVKNNK